MCCHLRLYVHVDILVYPMLIIECCSCALWSVGLHVNCHHCAGKCMLTLHCAGILVAIHLIQHLASQDAQAPHRAHQSYGPTGSLTSALLQVYAHK